MAVIATREIISGHDWIAYVFHDETDGGWQFHGPNGFSASAATVVGLGEILKLDPSVSGLLISLPLGCRASRASSISPWIVEKPCCMAK